jgi:hypothetical protein
MVPMQTGPTFRAFVPADGQALVHQNPTARTGLRGVRRRYGDDRLASLYRFASQEGQEPAPTRSAAALGELVVLEQVGRLQRFMRAGVVLADQRPRGLVVEVLTSPAHLLVRFGQQLHGRASAVTSRDASRHPTLRSLQAHLPDPNDAGGRDGLSVGQGRKGRRTEINPGLLARERQRLDGYIGTRAAGIPPVCFPPNRHRCGRAFEGPTPPHRNPTDLGKDQEPVVQRGPVAALFVGEAVVAGARSDTRLAPRLASLHAAEECLKRPIQAAQHVLQDLRVDILVFGPCLLDRRQVGALACQRDADTAPAPGFSALRQSSIGEFPTPPQDNRHRPFLLGSRDELVLEGLAQSGRFHITLFCLIGTPAARGEGPSSPGSSQGAFWPLAVNWDEDGRSHSTADDLVSWTPGPGGRPDWRTSRAAWGLPEWRLGRSAQDHGGSGRGVRRRQRAAVRLVRPRIGGSR